MNYIKIYFKNYKFIKFPKVKIYVDDDMLEEIHFTKEEQEVHIPLALENGKHKLEIEHFDKTSKDTQIKNGNIFADTKFTIKSIIIDNFSFPSSLLYLSEFTANWKDMHKPKDFPEILQQTLTIGPNGIWKLFFETPVEEWFIKRRIENNKKIKNNVVTYDSYEVSPHSTIDYILTEKDHQLIKDIKEMLNE